MRTLLTAVLLLSFVSAFAQEAREIIRMANDLMQGESSKGVMSMQIVRPGWTREIRMKSWTLGDDYSLIVIMEPARDEGVGFLKRDKELWNWQPRIDRIIKLPPSMMMQSWMGSDFTNDDLVKQSSIVDDYRHSIIKDTVIDGRPSWKLLLDPKEDAAVVWGRVEAYIAKEAYYQLLFKFYDEDGYLVNTMIMSDIRKLDDRVIPTRLEMIPADNPDQKTVVIYEDFDFGIELSTRFFSLQNLKKLR